MKRLLPLVALALLAACTSTGEPRPAPSSAAPTGSPRPTFADVSRGDTDSVVRLRAYEPRARSVVVEPTIFMQGPDFCTAFALPESDPRCNLEWTTEDSKTKVTLPVDAGARLLTMNGGDPDCLDDKSMAGTCRLTETQFSALLKNSGDLLVRLRTRDGTVVQMAEVYTP
ncbi:hypothetical protein Asp14428_03380 [Actinoplanes sp. NBRC 14428]|nr:hypothetical protein Asp14428_03380 [Actinoplanes sp. NBRC 14428]